MVLVVTDHTVDVRTFLIFHMSFVCPKLENVQRTSTNLILGIAELPYEERLEKLSRFSLSNRKTRVALITFFSMTLS